ncbi:MAG: hypothetical protein KBF78_00630 [Fuscovulum sp.]|jgi:hypothetical protein|nr:hypothetical protein [Fuscovulum sp.]
MLVKVILLFLAAMALVGMVGKLLFPGALPRLSRKAKYCPDCGRPMIGRSCTCKGKA